MNPFHLLFISLLLTTFEVQAAREIPHHLKKDWQEKTVFFGINKAWDYLKQEHTTLTYVARDEVFNYKEFSENKYWEGLKKAREVGLKFAGISNWKISKKSVEIVGPSEILIKVEGSYQVKRGLVHFIEWQHFIGEEYHQVAIMEDLKAHSPVPKKEIPQLFSNILNINKGAKP